MPFQFLRRVGRCGDRRLGVSRDEEASASKEGPLQVDDSSSDQDYFAQYPNQLAKIRLAYMILYHY